MSTYTEQDCLDQIARMKTWREDAGDALEEKGAIQDASNTLLADMPALIASIDTEPPYVRGTAEFISVTPSSAAHQFTMGVESNTSWTGTAVAMGADGAGITFSGTGDSSVTLTCSGAQPGASLFYRVLLTCNDSSARSCVWVQRYPIS